MKLTTQKPGSTGGTTTLKGPLVLASDPSQPLEAATKQYVDRKTRRATRYVSDLEYRVNLSSKQTGLIVPLYRYPYPSGDWDPQIIDYINAIKNYQGPVITIANPNSGPGTQIDVSYRRLIKMLIGAGSLVIGYVATGYGNRSLDAIKQDIDRWATYYPDVDGLFFDETEYDVDLTRANDFITYARSKGYEYICLNPGTEIPEDKFKALDVDLIITREGSDTSIPDAYEGDWEDSYRELSKAKRGAILHTQSSITKDLIDTYGKYFSYIYFCMNYNTIPDYLSEMISILNSRDVDIAHSQYSPTFGVKNIIINSDFRIWPRAQQITEDIADQANYPLISSHVPGWYVSNKTLTNVTSGRFTLQREVYENKYWCRLNINSGIVGTDYVIRPFVYFTEEDEVRHFVGKKVTLSFKFRAKTNGKYAVAIGYPNDKQFTIYEFDYTGAGNTQQCSYTFTVPNDLFLLPSAKPNIGLEFYFFYGVNDGSPLISDGSNINNGVFSTYPNAMITPPDAYKFWETTGDWVAITEVQLEPGERATEYEVRPNSLEHMLAQRMHYRIHSSGNTIFGMGISQGNYTDITITTPSTLRSSVALHHDPDLNNYAIVYDSNTVTPTDIAIQEYNTPNTNSVTLRVSHPTITAGTLVVFKANANTSAYIELIYP